MIARLLARLPKPGPIPVTCDPEHAWLLDGDDGDVIHAGDRLTALLVTLALASPRCVLRRTPIPSDTSARIA